MTLTRGKVFAIWVGCAALVYPAAGLGWLPIYPRKDERRDRTIIVTGATGMLGSSTAYWMAKRKARVIMACKDMQKCKMIRRRIVNATGHHGVACRYLDLEDIDSINSFADDMIKNEPHIDVLINNAAVKELKEKEITKYGIEKHYWVNYLAPFLLTFRLLPKLKESAAQTLDSRIINVIGKPNIEWTIDLGDINFDKRKYSGKKAYEQSKLALAYFTILLDKNLREERSNVFIYGTNPTRKWIQRPSFMNLDITVREKLWTLFEFIYTMEAERAAMPTVHCALDPLLAIKNKSGRLYGGFCASFWGWGGADKERDVEFSKRVWNHAIETLTKAPEYLKAAEEAKLELEAETKKAEDKTKKTEAKVEIKTADAGQVEKKPSQSWWRSSG